jgi:hypothetical protein
MEEVIFTKYGPRWGAILPFTRPQFRFCAQTDSLNLELFEISIVSVKELTTF